MAGPGCVYVWTWMWMCTRGSYLHNVGMVAGCGVGDEAVLLFLMGASGAESYSTIRVFLSFTRFCWFDVIILEQCVRIILFRESFMLRSIVCLRAHGVTPSATSIPLCLNVKCNARTGDVCFSKCWCESSTVHIRQKQKTFSRCVRVSVSNEKHTHTHTANTQASDVVSLHLTALYRFAAWHKIQRLFPQIFTFAV